MPIFRLTVGRMPGTLLSGAALFKKAKREMGDLAVPGGQIINGISIGNSIISMPEAGLDIFAAGSEVDG